MPHVRTASRFAAPAPAEGVSMLELFFDLVFVFTITQLTSLVRDSTTASGYLHAAAVLAITWWMYDGYAWLTNNVGPTTVSTRVPLLVAMTGFLVMATATPDAFGSGRWAFAISYLVVVLVHAGQFARSSLGGSARAIWQILPVNLAAAVGLIGAASVAGRWRWVFWLAAIAVLLGSVLTRRESGFTLRPAHFAERHQLVVIIALGETVVATGAGASGRIDQWRVVTALILSMALLSALWWLYFAGDHERAAAALESADPAVRTRRALLGYALVHLLHVIGLVLVAAGLREVVAEPGAVLSLRIAVLMAGGCAVFVAAQVVFLLGLGLDAGWLLPAGALVCLAAIPLGSSVSPLAQLAALVAILLCTVAVRRVEPARSA